MKVAFVTNAMPFGGAATFLLYLTDGLQQLGITSAVFSFADGNAFATEFSATGVPVHTVDATKMIFEDRVTALYQKIAEFKPTVVVANLGREAFEMLQYMPGGTTRVCIIHDPVNQAAPPIYREYLDGVVCVNPTWVEVTNRLTPGIPCKFLAHGIPQPPPGLARGPSLSAPLSLTYFGRLTEVKGAKVFPEIVTQLHARKIPFRWTIYGRGPEESYLREHLAAEIQKGQVTLAPFIPRHELYPTIRKHDVFIFASDIEGGPLTLLEAMAVGLVPICNDTPCLTQQVVTPNNGFIIARNAKQYADKFSILHQDRGCLEQMSAEARKTITESYSLKAMAERYVNFFKTVSPAPTSLVWPARIAPKPIRGMNFFARIAQSNGVARQVRRLVKKIRR
jgi:colanic acid/amylovoran biosynthesis glycosyltransferase